MTLSKMYSIAIPTYQRVKVCHDKTLTMLRSYNIDPSCITLFVADEDERNAYVNGIPQSMYGSIVVGKKGLTEQRNIIMHHYAKGYHVLMLDDDVRAFHRLHEGKLIPLENLHEFIVEGFRRCHEVKRHLWGVYSTASSLYMKGMKPQSMDVKFIIGHFMGLIIDHSHRIVVDIKEDYELSLHYSVKDGGVLRYNHVCAKTKMGSSGGINMNIKERQDRYSKAIGYLMLRYPEYVRANPRRENEILIHNHCLLSLSKGAKYRLPQTP